MCYEPFFIYLYICEAGNICCGSFTRPGLNLESRCSPMYIKWLTSGCNTTYMKKGSAVGATPHFYKYRYQVGRYLLYYTNLSQKNWTQILLTVLRKELTKYQCFKDTNMIFFSYLLKKYFKHYTKSLPDQLKVETTFLKVEHDIISSKDMLWNRKTMSY